MGISSPFRKELATDDLGWLSAKPTLPLNLGRFMAIFSWKWTGHSFGTPQSHTKWKRRSLARRNRDKVTCLHSLVFQIEQGVDRHENGIHNQRGGLFDFATLAHATFVVKTNTTVSAVGCHLGPHRCLQTSNQESSTSPSTLCNQIVTICIISPCRRHTSLRDLIPRGSFPASRPVVPDKYSCQKQDVAHHQGYKREDVHNNITLGCSEWPKVHGAEIVNGAKDLNPNVIKHTSGRSSQKIQTKPQDTSDCC